MIRPIQTLEAMAGPDDGVSRDDPRNGVDARLDVLRHLMARSRVWPRNAQRADPLERLVVTLRDVLGRGLKTHRPGTAEMSRDEAWIIALLASLDREDGASYQFLLRSRMSREMASRLHFVLMPAAVALRAQVRGVSAGRTAS